MDIYNTRKARISSETRKIETTEYDRENDFILGDYDGPIIRTATSGEAPSESIFLKMLIW